MEPDENEIEEGPTATLQHALMNWTKDWFKHNNTLLEHTHVITAALKDLDSEQPVST